jgi:adenosine deaminase
MVQRLACFLCLTALGLASAAGAQENPETQTGRYMESIRESTSLLLPFLREMPKGGDLHNHLAGSVYAESLIDFAAQDGFCVDRTTSILIAPPCDRTCDKYTSKPQASCAYQDQVLYNSMVDAWSMRNWIAEEGSAHDHFFASFDKFFPAYANHIGDSLADVTRRAAADHLQYLELMHTADGMQAALLGAKLGWNDDFAKMRTALLSSGLPQVISATRQALDRDEAKMKSDLGCDTAQENPGCGVMVRYLYQVLRGLPREQVFAQILLGFELAEADPRFVGLNLVMPEDWYVPMHDFDLHMKMLDYLHGVYPKVHISLHADELAMGLVPPEGLGFHIRESVEKGHAERIGHGVAVMNENRATQLLQELAKRNVLVEICLTSNDVILGVRGKDHPLATYRKYGVPVALASDDEGVSRSDMTHEYLRAVQDQRLSYSDLKQMARASLEHSFLPGESVWSNGKTFTKIPACSGDHAIAGRYSAKCTTFLDSNQKAQTEWMLERQFDIFENQVAQGK